MTMADTKKKKRYWMTVLDNGYKFQNRGARIKGVLTFSQTYGVGVKVRGKKVLTLRLRYPIGLMCGITCDRIDNLWEITVESLPPILCEAFAEGSISSREFAQEILRLNPIDESFPFVAKGVTPWAVGSDVRLLRDFLEDGLADWVSNGSGLRQE